MNRITFADAKNQQLNSDQDVVDRVDRLVGAAQRRQLWALFLDHDGFQRDLVVPIDDLPYRPEQIGIDYLIQSLGEILRMQGGGSLLLVRERPGGADPRPADTAWLELIRTSCERASVPLRGVVLSHDGGVCLHPEGAPEAASATPYEPAGRY